MLLRMPLLRLHTSPRHAWRDCREVSPQDLWWGRLHGRLIRQRLRRLRSNAPLTARPCHAALRLHKDVLSVSL